MTGPDGEEVIWHPGGREAQERYERAHLGPDHPTYHQPTASDSVAHARDTQRVLFHKVVAAEDIPAGTRVYLGADNRIHQQRDTPIGPDTLLPRNTSATPRYGFTVDISERPVVAVGHLYRAMVRVGSWYYLETLNWELTLAYPYLTASCSVPTATPPSQDDVVGDDQPYPIVPPPVSALMKDTE